MKRNVLLHFKCLWAMLVISFIAFACKKDAAPNESKAYDPSEKVAVMDFFPKTGGGGQQFVIYGKNFGNDKSIVSVTIGGKRATVISVQDEAIYCIIPDRAYTGEIEVKVGTNANQQLAGASEVFNYQKGWW
ncbi:IPT/TIG domain-containing protein [Niabella hibiscisoli]|uniref:IPT/TIG domain-containing protein n=1 Tax=Niabella hibiscisoli TaxID=1825928 RepID=UPI001F0FF313|nr:IPT/TIG domain-containing protein [Niabella hibiscisoli]MCH5718048.1 IPT/TIG domain-containing protein [Niabella hibiscisoli]